MVLAGLVGRSCCTSTANRAEEGNAARTRREERLESLDWQGSGRRADAEIATWTTWSWQRRTLIRTEEGGAEGKGLVSALPGGGQRRSLRHSSDLTQHSPAQSRDAA